jgi:ABC-type glutathione transport system ATPase component
LLTQLKSEPLLRIERLSKTYSQGHWWEKKFTITALDSVDLQLDKGKTVALVGKSGSGKTTLALCVAMLERPTSGQIWLDGLAVFALGKSARAKLRPEVQLIFQDSAAALPARFSAAQIIEEPLLIQNRYSAVERSEMVLDLMDKVGLPPAWAQRFSHQFSGGQRQRLAIARSLALRPKLLVLDEPFVGLDLSVRGQIINLLVKLQVELSLTYLCISHDLDLVRYFADKVAVMDQGRIVEQGNIADLFRAPACEQTRALLGSRASSGNRFSQLQ